MSRSIGVTTTLSLEHYCSECGGAYIVNNPVSPVHFNHDGHCPLGDQITSLRLSDHDRHELFGAGCRPFRQCELTLLHDRGAVLQELAEGEPHVCIRRNGVIRYYGVTYPPTESQED